MTPTPEQGVRVSEPHWYLLEIDNGCVICCAGAEDRRVRVAGQRPEQPEDRVHLLPDHACSHHFL